MYVDTDAVRWFQQVADGMTVTEVSEIERVTQSGVSRARNGQVESPRTCHDRAASKRPRTTSPLVTHRVPLTEADDCGHTLKSGELDNLQRELGSSEGVVDGQVS
jgi:hypothetical protein